jgi:hypothetical protein
MGFMMEEEMDELNKALSEGFTLGKLPTQHEPVDIFGKDSIFSIEEDPETGEGRLMIDLNPKDFKKFWKKK